MEALLEVDDLTVTYESRSGMVTAVDNVSLDLFQNELLSLVGESGCGKSTLGLSIIGLLPKPGARITHGSIRYKDKDLTKLDGNRIREYRGTEIAMIFQEPLVSLSPVFRVGEQIAEAITVRELRKQGGKEAVTDLARKGQKTSARFVSRVPRLRPRISPDIKSEIIEYLKLVRISDPEQVIDRYPFELSGGMTQRVMIAMALSQEPSLLIADEPTTALDVTTQAQVLRLMRELMSKVRTGILLVTHDLAVASQVADRIVVMYAGEIVEDTDADSLFSEPLHPYTQGLLACIPSGSKHKGALKPIPGSLPDLRDPLPACKFAPRCQHAMKVCLDQRPQLFEMKKAGKSHRVSCFLYGE